MMQLDGGKLRLKPQQALFVARLHQLKNKARRRCEGDGEAAPACGETQSQADMRLSRAAVAERNVVVARDDIFAAGEFERERLVERGDAVKSNVLKLFTAGKRAARLRRSLADYCVAAYTHTLSPVLDAAFDFGTVMA